jgi:hypothetical protein
MIILHLMSFDDVTTYNLEIPEGRLTGEWKLKDSDGNEVEGITKFSFSSNRLSETHDIVLNREEGDDLLLAVIGIQHKT